MYLPLPTKATEKEFEKRKMDPNNWATAEAPDDTH